MLLFVPALLAFTASFQVVASVDAFLVLPSVDSSPAAASHSPGDFDDPSLFSRRRLVSTFDQVGESLFGSKSGSLFGQGVKLSSDGLRLAVGAPGYDSNATVNDNIGSVTMFDLVGSEWVPGVTIVGAADEAIGARLSLSGTGDRVAVRHLREQNDVNPHFVTVYDAASGLQLGGDLTCGDYGQGVAISPDGNRVAVSCENFGNNRGRVEIFDFIGGVWTSVGIIDGTDNQSLFGWATAFDLTGNRLAISAPFHDANGLTRPGLIQVWEYNSTDWNQVGSDIYGDDAQDRIGLALDLSDDGTTVVIGSSSDPGTGTGRGTVKVFELSAGSWSLKGPVVDGEEDGDAFGRAVSINADGSRWAASSFLHNGNQGQVRFYSFEAAEWSLVGDFDGLASGDNFGFGLNSICISGDGRRIAFGSTLGDDPNGPANTGRVRVFNEDTTPSQAPSDSPTLNPTPSPTTLPPTPSPTTAIPVTSLPTTSIPTTSGPTTPSPVTPAPITGTPTTLSPITPSPTTGAPSSSPEPTSLVVGTTTTPTVTLGKFDWDLDRVGDVIVAFNDQTDTEEISLTYSIHLRDYEIRIFEEDCLTSVPDSVVGVASGSTISNSTHGSLTVNLDIKQDSVVGSGIWFDGDIGVGFVSLCVRVDLLNDDANSTSVQFNEQRLFVTVDLTQDFHVEDIDLERDAPAEETETATINYDIYACQCNASYVCNEETLTQGSDIYICVFSNESNVEIASIPVLDFKQGNNTYRVVDEGLEDSLTEVTLGLNDGKLAVIRSQLISELFENSDPADLLAWGDAVIAFVNSRTRALRPSIIHGGRRMSDEPATAGFNAKVALESSHDDSSVEELADSSGGTAAVVGITVVLVCAALLGLVVG